jgi:hypothetical protein
VDAEVGHYETPVFGASRGLGRQISQEPIWPPLSAHPRGSVATPGPWIRGLTLRRHSHEEHDQSEDANGRGGIWRQDVITTFSEKAAVDSAKHPLTPRPNDAG